jgi:hypothetical protein
LTHHADAARPTAVFPLLADGALRLEADPALIPLVRRWLPLLPYETPSDAAGARIRVVTGDPARIPAPAGAPVVRLGAAAAWVDDARAHAVLRADAGCACEADLGRGEATLVVPPAADAAGPEEWDVFSLCTVTAALLLGRMHRALVHAAAVVAPGGGAWLLVGDTHAGKSTTSVNLIEAGWRFVSDDHVVLFRGMDGRLSVEGWPRRFHLDEGWAEGAPGRVRGEVHPHERWPGAWMRVAPLAGLLFPRVAADEPTELSPIAPVDALGGLMRQSPWLLADRSCAAEVLAFLRSACELPAYALRLGLDTYRDTARLLAVLAPLG